MNQIKKICVITGSRAEYGLLHPLIKEILTAPQLQLQLITTGTHLAPEFGLTYRDIEKDGFAIDQKVEIPLSNDSAIGTSQALGTAVIGITNALNVLKPDCIVLLGDRFEIFAAATAAMISRIPIAHIHGGESTLGAFDESIRHAITKMSLLHFAAAEPYRQRIIQMGESPDRVFNVGALALDNIRRLKLLSRQEIEKEIGFSLGALNFVLTYHPVTLESEMSDHYIQEFLAALDSYSDARLIFTLGNADPQHSILCHRIREYVKRNDKRAAVFDSLGTLRYLSLIQHSQVVVGNSSSGIIEAPALKKPTVNIGNRQAGRLMADSIVQSAEDRHSIINAIQKALSAEFQKNLAHMIHPYGNDQGAATKMKNILINTSFETRLLKKVFYTPETYAEIS